MFSDSAENKPFLLEIELQPFSTIGREKTGPLSVDVEIAQAGKTSTMSNASVQTQSTDPSPTCSERQRTILHTRNLSSLNRSRKLENARKSDVIIKKPLRLARQITRLTMRNSLGARPSFADVHVFVQTEVLDKLYYEKVPI